MEAVARLSMQLDDRAEPLRAEIRRLIAEVEDLPPQLRSGALLEIVGGVLVESHPRNAIAGSLLGIGVAEFHRAGADLATVTAVVDQIWAVIAQMNGRATQPPEHATEGITING
jgi:hypothetical protein